MQVGSHVRVCASARDHQPDQPVIIAQPEPVEFIPMPEPTVIITQPEPPTQPEPDQADQQPLYNLARRPPHPWGVAQPANARVSPTTVGVARVVAPGPRRAGRPRDYREVPQRIR